MKLVDTTRKLRLDQALVQRGLCPTREKARRAVLAGQVLLRGHKAKKASDLVQPQDNLALTEPERFVSRGGFKLEHALGHFQIAPLGWIAVDLGASTGGFTDCLLQRGAAKVFAVDVGRSQLASQFSLRADTLKRMSNLGATLGVTFYHHAKNERSAPAKPATRKRKRK